jgi:general secretion pathway protein D
MATITGRNVVVDPRVKGQLNLNTERPCRQRQWPSTSFWPRCACRASRWWSPAACTKWCPRPTPSCKAAASAARWQPAPAGVGGQIVTQIFKLNYENANNLVPVLRPLISPNNTINVNPGNNSLVITDYADNLQRLGASLALDVSNATDVEIIPLKHAMAPTWRCWCAAD